MAFPTAVNDQVTDSVTQASVSVAGTAPAVALGSLYSAHAQSMAAIALGATQAQQQGAVTAQAATVACVRALLGGQA